MSRAPEEMWNSKLGNSYPKAEIHRSDREYHAYLKKLRQQPANQRCCDCDATDGALWAVVNIGSFVCVRCASLHRGVGTHISKVKGCSGTYLWGPDEIANMIGNAAVREIYGGTSPGCSAGDQEVRSFIMTRYHDKRWFNKQKHENVMASIKQPGYLQAALSGAPPPKLGANAAEKPVSSDQSAFRGPAGAVPAAESKTSRDLATELFPDLLDFSEAGKTKNDQSPVQQHPLSTYPGLPKDFDPFAPAAETSTQASKADPFDLFFSSATSSGTKLQAKNSSARTTFGFGAKPLPADVADDFFDNW